jgi:protease-4
MQNFRDDARAFYRRFLERVGQARALDRRRMHRYARGRVYTGRDALDRGLVDGLGGLEAAQKILYELCETTPKKAPFEYIEHRKQSLRSVVSGSLIQASPTQQRIEGFAKHTLAPLEVAAWLEREPLLALLPWQLDNLTRE